MGSAHHSVLAVRAIIAIFIRRTLGRLCFAATGIALIIGLLASINAMIGIYLLWIIATLAYMTALSAALLGSLVFFATGQLLPKNLKSSQKKFIYRFARKLQKRLELTRVPLPVFIWRLLINAVVLQLRGREEQKIEQAIDDSKMLSTDFRTIKGFFTSK